MSEAKSTNAQEEGREEEVVEGGNDKLYFYEIPTETRTSSRERGEAAFTTVKNELRIVLDTRTCCSLHSGRENYYYVDVSHPLDN